MSLAQRRGLRSQRLPRYRSRGWPRWRFRIARSRRGGADPFRELRRLQSEMDRVMGALSGPGQLAAAGAFPAVNVYAGQGGIAVVARTARRRQRRPRNPGAPRYHPHLCTASRPATLRAERSIPSAGEADGVSRSFSFLTGSTRSHRSAPENAVAASLARPDEDKPRSHHHP